MIYLDNSATTRPCGEAVEAVVRALETDYFNPSAAYAPAVRAEEAVAVARRAVAAALGVPPETVIFTSGGTEANNAAFFGAASRGQGGRVLCSAVEHPSVLEACARQGGAVIPVDRVGLVDREALANMVDEHTSLVSVMQVNNETGAVQDIEGLCALVKERNPAALFHCDGVQAFQRLPMPRGVDLYTLSGHKVMAPKGVGALYVRPGVRLEPFLVGGGQEKNRRSGTENVPAILGLGAACAAWAREGEAWRARLRNLRDELVEALRTRIPDLAFNGPEPGQGAPHILSVSCPGVGAEVLLHALEGEGILVGNGSACSSRKKRISHVLEAMGTPVAQAKAAIRLSLSPQNTREEMVQTAEAIARILGRLRRYQRR